MNISQHVLLPFRYEVGQWAPNFRVSATTSGATQFFHYIFSPLRVFPIPSNWRSVYGPMYLYTSSQSPLLTNELSVSQPFTIYDAQTPSAPSKFMSLILY